MNLKKMILSVAVLTSLGACTNDHSVGPGDPATTTEPGVTISSMPTSATSVDENSAIPDVTSNPDYLDHVKILGCKRSTEFDGYVDLKVRVTNKLEGDSFYLISVAILDETGTQVSQLNANLTGSIPLSIGDTRSYEQPKAADTELPQGSFTCKLGSVSRSSAY